MLGFEREVMNALIETDDVEARAGIESFVDGSLHAMPEHLRAAIGAASLGLGACRGAVRLVRPSVTGAAFVQVLDHTSFGPARQYVRLLRSLVLFAEQELTTPAPADAAGHA